MTRVAFVLAVGMIMIACVLLDTALFHDDVQSGTLALQAVIIGAALCLIAATAPSEKE